MAFHGSDHRGEVVFMTTKEREMFPMKTAQDKFGNMMNPMRGSSQTGPGCYNNDEKTTLVYVLNTKTCSTKGYSLGARTAQRKINEVLQNNPCPTQYQTTAQDPKEFKPSKKPFDMGSGRFPSSKRTVISVTPGAGTYDHNIHLNRKVQWHQSFGGSPVLLPAVTLRSTIDRNTEKLYSTKEEKKYQRKLAYLKLYY